MNTEDTAASVEFDEWAKVELMGHVVMIGRVTKAPIGDFLRIDVPKPDGAIAWTKLVNPKAVYALTPISRDLALRLVARYESEPISRFELPMPVAPAPAVEPSDDGESIDHWGTDDED